MSDDRFVVEADRKVVGVAVKVSGGFKFFSSDPDFIELDTQFFPRARAMAQRVATVARKRRRRAGQDREQGATLH